MIGKRRAGLAAAGIGVVAAALFGSAAPAVASTAPSTPHTRAERAVSPHKSGWSDTGQSFYWYDSCDSAGKAGISTGSWDYYSCEGGSLPWESYELWIWTS